MKIVVLTTSYPRFNGDYSGFISGLYEKMVLKKNKIKVVAPHDAKSKTYELMNKVEIFRPLYASPKWEVVAYNSGIADNLKKSLLSKIELPFFVLSFIFKSYRVCKGCDLIHAHWTFCGLVAVLLKIFHKKPIVLTVHGSDLTVFPKFLNKLVFRKVNQIITVSSFLKKEIEKMGADGEKITVIFNGIPNLESFLRIKYKIENHNAVLWVGRFIEDKNPLLLISSFKKVVRKIPTAQLTMIYFGSLGAKATKIKNNIEKTKLRNNIFFEGEKTPEELLKYFQKADLLVLPSKREGFGVVLIEAMAAARPVIGSKVGGILDIIEDNINGLFFKNNSDEDLSKKIIKVLTDKKLRERLAKEGRKTAKKRFAWNKIVASTMEIYEKARKK